MNTKWAAPVTYGASKYEVMTDELHARPVAVINTLDDAFLIAAAPELLSALDDLIAQAEYAHWGPEDLATAYSARAKAIGSNGNEHD